jgi:hypothetical protein
MSNKRFSLPVSSRFDIRDVLTPYFDISKYEEAYVNLDDLRKTNQKNTAFNLFEKLSFQLNFEKENDKWIYVREEREQYTKFIFSGHRGTGKSAELYRLYKKISEELFPTYLTVFIKMDEGRELSSFSEQHFLPMLVFHLGKALEESPIKVEIDKTEINELLADLLGITKEDYKKMNLQLGVKGIFSLTFGDFYFRENLGTRVQKVFKEESSQFIIRFNQLLDKIRRVLENKEILFIIDGSEKIRLDVYQKLFIENRDMINSIRTLMVIAVPISTHFQITHRQDITMFEIIDTLPMFRVNEKDLKNNNSQLVKKHLELVEKRAIIDNLISLKDLKLCIKYSGGCIRQFFNLIYTAFVECQGNKIDTKTLESVIMNEGRRIYETLESRHLNVIKSNQYQTSDKEVAEMLYSLAILKYNGDRALNPLLRLHLEKYYPKMLPDEQKN